MIRDFVHLIQNKLRHYAVFPSLHSLSRSSAFQTALFLLGVLAFARACIFLAPPSVTALASASVNGTFMPICRVETDQKKVALTFNCTYSAQDLHQLLEILKEKNVHATFFVSDTWAKNYPKLLCTIHNAGHDIGGLWTTQASLSIRLSGAVEHQFHGLERLRGTGHPPSDFKQSPTPKRLYPPVPCRNCLYRTGASRPDRQSGGSGLSASSHLRADLEALLLYGCRRRTDSEDGTVNNRMHALRAFYCLFSSFLSSFSTSSIDVQYGQRVASAATLLLQ